MQCVFHNKFKKWVPEKVVDDRMNCVNINDLLYLSKMDGPGDRPKVVSKNGYLPKAEYRPNDRPNRPKVGPKNGYLPKAEYRPKVLQNNGYRPKV